MGHACQVCFLPDQWVNHPTFPFPPKVERINEQGKARPYVNLDPTKEIPSCMGKSYFPLDYTSSVLKGV